MLPSPLLSSSNTAIDANKNQSIDTKVNRVVLTRINRIINCIQGKQKYDLPVLETRFI